MQTCLLIFLSSIALVWYPFYRNPLFIEELKWSYVAIVGTGILMLLARKRTVVLPTLKSDAPVIALGVGALGIGMFLSQFPFLSLSWIWPCIGLYGIYVGSSWMKATCGKTRMIFIMLMGAVGAALWYLGERVYMIMVPSPFFVSDIVGSFSNKNNLAVYLATMLPLTGLFFGSSRKIVRTCGLISCGVLLFTLLTIQSRAGLLSAAIGVSMALSMLLRFDKRIGEESIRWMRSPWGVMSVVIIGVLVVGVWINKDALFQRVIAPFLASGDRALLHRTLMWLTASDIIKDHWFTGVGIGMYEFIHPSYQAPYFIQYLNSPLKHLLVNYSSDALAVSPHNDVLHVLVECGIVGFGIVSALVVVYVRRILGCIRVASTQTEQLCGALILCSSVTLLIAGIFQSALHQAATAVWICMVLGMYRTYPLRIESRRSWGMQLLGGVLFVSVCMGVIPFVAGNVYCARAYRATDQGKDDAALSLYQKAMQLKPLDYKIPLNYGNLLLKKKLFDDAFSCYERAVLLHPFSANALNSMGAWYLAQGNNEKALEFFQKAYAISPQFFGPVFNSAIAAYNLGDRETTVAYLTQASFLKPDDLFVSAFFEKVGEVE